MGSDKTTNQKVLPSGNGITLDQLVEDHYDYLYRYAFRYFRSEERAEDIVQETYLAAATAFKRYQGNAAPRTWLTSILRHKIMDILRKKNIEEPTDFDAMERDNLSHLFDDSEHWRRETGPLLWGNNPDSELIQKQFFKVLDQCLSKLPTKMRQIFLLRELEGHERNEISVQLGLTGSNVGVMLNRARLSLQACLQTHWYFGVRAGGNS